MPFIKQVLFICLIVAAFFQGAVAQNIFNFQHLSLEQGLSQNTVNAITQDDDGYMWLGTTDGLNRYNGYSVDIYRNIEKDSTTIPVDYIDVVYKDRKNNLWIGTGEGLSLYDKYTNSFKTKRDTTLINGIKRSKSISAITDDDENNLWVGTRHGLYKMNLSTFIDTVFLFEDTNLVTGYYKNRVCDLVLDKQNNIWIATLDGLHCMNLKTNAYHTFRKNAQHPELLDGRISSLAMDKKGRIWIAYYDHGIMIYDPADQHFKTTKEIGIVEDVSAVNIKSIFCDRENNIWMACRWEGLTKICLKTGFVSVFQNDIFTNTSLADNKTMCLFQDNSGMIWIGTASEGAERTLNSSEKFTSYRLQPGKPGSMCQKDITAFAEEGSKIWICSSNGVMRFDTVSKTFECISKDPGSDICLPHSSVNGMALEKNGTLWFSSTSGLSRVERKNGNKICKTFHYDSLDVNGIPANEVFDVLIRKNGDVLIALTRGMAKYVPSKNEWLSRNNDSTLSHLTRAFFYVLFEDSKNNIWIGTSNFGLIKCDSNLVMLANFRKRKNAADSLPDNTIFDIDEDADGNIWLATQNGLSFYNPFTKKFKSYKTANGIPSNYITAVKTDKRNSVWVTSHAGLSHIQFKEQPSSIFSIRNYTVADGLQSNSFNESAGILLKNGTLIFGGPQGFTVVPDDPIRSNSYLPQIQITSFRIYDQSFPLTEEWFQKKQITLSYDQRFFSFEMAAMNFNHPDQNQFAYQLIGFDDKIQYAGLRHYASYTNVPPGTYTLHIMASNNDGVWNKDGLRIKLVIVPPFWKTAWFSVLMILTFLLSLYLIFTYRLKKLREQEIEKADIHRKISEARIAALRAQMNPHFVFNALNSIQHFIMENDREGALKYLSKFSKLTRLVLRNANKNYNALSDELLILEWYLELEWMRFGGKFDYKIDVDKDIDITDTEMPGMLLQPFVENSIVHGLLNKKEKGYVTISISKTETMMMCIIDDNGIGREAANLIKEQKKKDHESVGIKIAEERLNMLRKNQNRTTSIVFIDKKDAYGNALGTHVEIAIELD